MVRRKGMKKQMRSQIARFLPSLPHHRQTESEALRLICNPQKFLKRQNNSGHGSAFNSSTRERGR